MAAGKSAISPRSLLEGCRQILGADLKCSEWSGHCWPVLDIAAERAAGRCTAGFLSAYVSFGSF
jgi:hypothetical protein